MKTRGGWLGVIAMLLVAPVTLASQSAVEIYQRALVQDQAAGDLRQAASLYHRAAVEAGADRALAARALLRAAAAEEKLGDPRAVETYRKVLDTYGEQRDAATVAQSRLAALRPSATARQAGTAAPPDVPSVVADALETYCVRCHSVQQRSANLDLQTLRAQGLAPNAAVWERLLQRLRARLDPQPGMSRPDDAAYRAMVESLEAALDQVYSASGAPDTAARLDGVALANRMAAFLWGDQPADAVLLDAARRGALGNDAVLEQQVRRMLRDSRSNALVARFFERWMLRDGFANLSTATLRFAGPNGDLHRDFATETRLFLQRQIRDDRSALELWTADYTFVNERLARHYGIPGVTGANFRRVALPDLARRGILGQGSFLTVTSHADRTSPVTRGKVVMQLFWGLDPPVPPPNVPVLGGSNDRPMRERMKEATKSPACVNCHRIFEQYGFAMENFNPVGAWQTSQGGSGIDTTGVFPDGSSFDGPADLRDGLLKTRDAYYTNITRSLLGFALGREGLAWRTYESEMPTVRAALREASVNDYRWSSIVLGIVRSDPFQRRAVLP